MKSLARAYTKFKRPKRVLRGVWTVESVEDLRALHGLDVEAELAKILIEEINAAAKTFMKEVDLKSE
jgi:hypothetical protein